MGEIKFRRYHFDFTGKCYHVSEWGFLEGGYISPSSLSNEDKSKAIDCQFIGLHDKNGKEIYEGDVVQVHHAVEVPSTEHKGFELLTEDKIGTVIFNSGSFDFKHHLSASELKGHQEAFPDSDTDEISQLYYYTHEGNSVEVIGNIYDNPELLNA